ncbi:MAG: LPS export ABC transporter ATP-binding protein [Gammaproteobacteria bacterium]|jgi:lipopolysaccharide export system ATP-binding protein|nr:LPS export ABC transporter ATP-binding protein [Gammaproteobacteria bacterium]
MSILRASHLVKHYRRRKVVNDVSLHVESGEIVGLLGPNGAGKTTCFYMIAGLIPASRGEILLDNHNITHLPMPARARLGLGYLPQDASVFRKLTVSENILAILQTRKSLNKAQRLERMQNLLDELQIDHIRDSNGISLSGGERRRVEIARALAAEPAFILLDEPFAGVDPISVLEIQRIIRQLAEKNIGIIITDHNVRETLGICQRAYILSAGEVIAEGNPESVLTDQQVREVYLGQNFHL